MLQKFSFVVFVKWRTKFGVLFKAKFILLEGQKWYYLTHSWRGKEVHAFPKSDSPKVNVMKWMKFEFAYDDAAI